MSADDKTRILPEPARTIAGTQLSGIYELDERIASGGMGEVFRGHNIQTGDLVAIKIVLPEFARDQTVLALFRKEASILNHLSHDAVVRYHVFTIDPGIGRPYLAMEFVDGESVADVMRRGAMSPQDVRKLCHRLASGLSAVHEAGTVHRDLSPDNVILPEGRVERAKIIDFGIARSATKGETLIGGKFAGKYNYVSPEQLGLYGGKVSDRSDIYSLGLVLAAALRGKPIEMDGTQFELVEKRRSVPDLSDIDGDFRPIIAAMLQPDPADRPASMAEIAWATREGAISDIGGRMANSIAPRDQQSSMPQTGQPFAARPWAAPGVRDGSIVGVAGEPRFVPHIPPAHLSQPFAAAPTASAAVAPRRSKGARNIAIAVVAVAVVASGVGGAYLGGFLTPRLEPPPLEPKIAVRTAAIAASGAATYFGGLLTVRLKLPPPKPPEPPQTDPKVADPISWVRAYSGGDCFYATVTSAPDTPVEIEGFGTTDQPFATMLAAFQAKFHVDPKVGVRVIDPAQCEVTQFLRALGATTAERPKLVLDQMSVPNGAAVSGTLEMRGGLKSSLFLIDHDGMVFNLDNRVVVKEGKATFSIPISLGAADKAAGTVVPQLLLAISGAADVKAASFSSPMPATVAFPNILEEIQEKRLDFSATAQYFRLGG